MFNVIEQLPISIQPCDELIVTFPKIRSVTNKLEAQFNFQTLTAGWYGEEDNILRLNLRLESPLSFLFRQSQAKEAKIIQYADDAFSFFDENQNIINCFIVFTQSEITLIEANKILLNGILQAKTHKILNRIAAEHKLFPI